MLDMTKTLKQNNVLLSVFALQFSYVIQKTNMASYNYGFHMFLLYSIAKCCRWDKVPEDVAYMDTSIGKCNCCLFGH